MDSENTLFAMLISFIIGAVLMGLFLGNVGVFAIFKAEKLRDACELNIPRNQHCIMQFVPESK